MRKTKSITKDNYDRNRPVIIYGASAYGELAYIALEQLGIRPDYFCDQVQKERGYFGIKVIHPDKLLEKPDANLIIASADYFYDIVDELKNKGCTHLYDMEELLRSDIPVERLSNRAKEMYANRQHYIDVVNYFGQENTQVLNRVQFVVTERCSLRCRDCTHLMQYYQQPKDINLDQYKEAFDVLLDAVGAIGELRILGGEPFVNKEMHKAIDWYCGNDKIKSISVYTNGTIIPDEKTLHSLKREKVKVHISNYGINKTKVSLLTDVFKKHKIVFFERVYDAWQDAGDVRYREHTQEHMEHIFSRCFERSCLTFLKGTLHRCPRSAHAMNIGAMPDIKNDYIDLLHWDGNKTELEDQIRTLLDKKYIEACNYCDGPNNHTQSIPPALQIKAPLAYEKIAEEDC